MSAPAPAWVGDPRISWRILLTAALADPVVPEAMDRRLAALAVAQDWPSPPPLRRADSLASLRAELLLAHPAPLLAGIAEGRLVLSAHHSALDGLGLLSVLERCGLGPVRSGARGVGDRPTTGGLVRTVAQRLTEVALRPPAGVTPPPRPVSPRRRDGDVLIERSVPGSHRTGALVRAATSAIVAHQTTQGRSARRVAVAVGAVRDQADAASARRLSDRSVLLRLRDVERLDAAGVTAALGRAAVQTPPVAARPRPWSPLLHRASAIGLRLLAPRLGSTLLVSHLGEVTAPQLPQLAFHPVTAGGSGISLGAVGLRGSTVLTLRARASGWDDEGLEQLLEAVASYL